MIGHWSAYYDKAQKSAEYSQLPKKAQEWARLKKCYNCAYIFSFSQTKALGSY